MVRNKSKAISGAIRPAETMKRNPENKRFHFKHKKTGKKSCMICSKCKIDIPMEVWYYLECTIVLSYAQIESIIP